MPNGIKKRFLQICKQITVKKVMITLLTVLIIFIPTILAKVYTEHAKSSNSEEMKRVHTVELLDASGKKLFSEEANLKENGDTSLVSIFNAISNNMLQSDKISENVVTEAPLTARLISQADVKILTCYFSFTEGASYCVDGNGIYYKIPAADSERFLASPFSESLYKEASSHTLSTANGDVILPTHIDWHYLNTNGTFLSASLNESTEETLTYNVTGGISLSFSKMPDKCTVEIYDGNELLFSGNLEELSALTLDYGVSFYVSVNAEWTRTDDSKNFGAAEYGFNVTVQDRAEFTIDKTELSFGEYAILKATHVSDISKITFTSDIPGFNPIFKLDGTNAFAVIPCPSAVSENGSYGITVSYGISTQSFKLTASEASVLQQAKLNKYFEEFELSKKLSDISASSFIFVNGETHAPDGYIKNNSSNSRDTFFTEYICLNGYGMPIKAITGGTVALTGSEAKLGTYAVIDIGLGINVIYANMSSTDVNVGDCAATGDIVGRTGELSDGTSEGFIIFAVYQGTMLNINSIYR